MKIDYQIIQCWGRNKKKLKKAMEKRFEWTWANLLTLQSWTQDLDSPIEKKLKKKAWISILNKNIKG